MEKETSQVWLSYVSWGGKIIMDYVGGLHVVYRGPFKMDAEESESQKEMWQ